MPKFQSTSPVMKELGSIKWTVVIIIGMIAIMAYATYVESQEGHAAAMAKGFHSLPMDMLIVALAVNIIACTIGRAPYKVHQVPWLVTHLGILLTMAGAIVSHRTSMEGQIILRVGQPASAVSLFNDGPVPMEVPLGFTLHLDAFRAEFYPGTGKASNYTSWIRWYDEGKAIAETTVVQVNHPIVHRGWNISQSSFFPGDNNATILGANKDPGTPVSYSGFITVFLGLVGMFFLKPYLKQKYSQTPPPTPKIEQPKEKVEVAEADVEA